MTTLQINKFMTTAIIFSIKIPLQSLRFQTFFITPKRPTNGNSFLYGVKPVSLNSSYAPFGELQLHKFLSLCRW